MVHDLLLCVLGTLFTVDLIVRVRDIKSGKLIKGSPYRVGVLPLSVLACSAIVSTIFVGWLGWVLGAVAGLASVMGLQIANLPDRPWEYPLLNGLLIFAHILVTGICLKVLLIDVAVGLFSALL
jgi:hypothetical protein